MINGLIASVVYISTVTSEARLSLFLRFEKHLLSYSSTGLLRLFENPGDELFVFFFFISSPPSSLPVLSFSSQDWGAA